MAQNEITSSKVGKKLENKLSSALSFDKSEDVANLTMMAIGGATTATVVTLLKLRLWKPSNTKSTVSRRKTSRKRKK